MMEGWNLTFHKNNTVIFCRISISANGKFPEIGSLTVQKICKNAWAQNSQDSLLDAIVVDQRFVYQCTLHFGLYIWFSSRDRKSVV